MNIPKYEISTNPKHQHPDNPDLYRIRALRNIQCHGVKKGDLGGYVESEGNLSQDGECWIGGDAVVEKSAVVRDAALVTGHARVSGNASVIGASIVSGTAQVHGNVVVKQQAHVSGNAFVTCDAVIKDFAYVAGPARVGGREIIEGHAILGKRTSLDPKGARLTLSREREGSRMEITVTDLSQPIKSLLKDLGDEEWVLKVS